MPRTKKSAKKDPVEKLVRQAVRNSDQFQNDIALEFCKKALALNPHHLKALELAANLLLEEGNYEEARQRLAEAVQVSPDKGHEKFFSLAQLFEGKDSLDCCNKGIDILVKELDLLNSPLAPSNSGSEVKRIRIQRELSNAYCSVAEIFMSDLCDEPDAEEQCVGHFEKAISIDDQNPEAYQCKASYLLIKGNIEESKNAMTHSLSLWLPQLRAVMEGQSDDFDPIEVCLMPYNTRVDSAKLLIELEEFESAGEVLEGLITEDDENVQIWYLMGLNNYLRKDDFYNNARYYFKKAKKVAAKVPGDPTIMKHIDELLTEIGPGEDDESSDEEQGAEDKENGGDESDSFDDYSTDDETIDKV